MKIRWNRCLITQWIKNTVALIIVYTKIDLQLSLIAHDIVSRPPLFHPGINWIKYACLVILENGNRPINIYRRLNIKSNEMKIKRPFRRKIKSFEQYITGKPAKQRRDDNKNRKINYFLWFCERFFARCSRTSEHLSLYERWAAKPEADDVSSLFTHLLFSFGVVSTRCRTIEYMFSFKFHYHLPPRRNRILTSPLTRARAARESVRGRKRRERALDKGRPNKGGREKWAENDER